MKSDSQVQKDVMDQLKWDPLLNSAQSPATTHVDSRNAAYSAPGIFQIDNRITIDTPEYSYEE